MKSPHRARALLALAALFFAAATPSLAQLENDRGAQDGILAIAAAPGSPDAQGIASISSSDTKSLADGLYMDGVWQATYGAGFSSVTVTLPFIYNDRLYTSGTLRLSYWATTYYPARGASITGYRLATFATFAPLLPYHYYYDIVRSGAMSVPPNGTYWLVLVLEEYDPSRCSDPGGYCLADDAVSFQQRTFGPATAGISLNQSVMPNPASVGKDLVYDLKIYNSGPATATNVVLTDTIPGSAAYIWASPGCSGTVTVTCSIGSIAAGGSASTRIVIRPSVAGVLTNFASATASEFDPVTSDNSSSVSVSVNVPLPGVPALRYRLYSPVSLEHHFTTDLNEYNVLGASGAWIQEGTVGKVLNNPGSFGGVGAVPYYRLYNTFTRWHHWTTDPNEYYTLTTYPGWNGEGVDGYLLPSTTSGATQLFRLVYPNGTGLHHWTTDSNEYSVLITVYGWVGEGGTGYVVR